ncbi:serine/threonine protein kinase [Streptomyces sp. NPDC005231]|uniref:AbiJ-related protein n=1 Tax=Streptomyces sp. NPDC005231 TaxID=3157026 RepID=UPI0033AD05B2
MQFTVLPFRTRPDSPHPGETFLVRDNWDDYRFKTTFHLLYADEGGEVQELGSVKIGRFGMSAPATTSVPEDFETLDDAFFSLGQDDAYYEGLRELGAGVQQTVLRALNDVAFDLDLFSRARNESVMGTSLLRAVPVATVIHRFRGRDVSSDESSPAITEVTRRRLFVALQNAGTTWSGSLDEVTFLRRLYDLDHLESFDPRFATAEGDIVQHRYNNPGDWEDDWVFNDRRFGLADGPDEVLLRFLAEMIHPAVRTDTDEVERLLALINDTLAPDGYKLTPAQTVSGYPVYEARRISVRHRPAHHTPAPTRAAAFPRTDLTSASEAAHDSVRRNARGERKDYLCPREPVPDGGQADVFRATHKATGTIVALKKLHQKYPSDRQVARMRREIEIGQLLDGHPHAMPILDFGTDHTWFVMPWAEATAEDRRESLQEPAHLRALVNALASVLSTAHEPGWLHRDIKPSNILYLDGRWTLADWGIVRRPRGQTTKVGRTGLYIGTEGFAAPELSETPHDATASSDIYSMGRVIAWALTGDLPRTNLPLLPPPGPWRSIVRAATHQDPQRRPQAISDLLALIDREHVDYPQDPLQTARTWLEAANHGDPAAADALLTLASDHKHDYELYVGVLTLLATEHTGPALERDPLHAQNLLRTLAEHVDGDDTHRVQFGEAAVVVTWLHGVCAYAASQTNWDLLEETAHAMCTWDGAWDQWNARDRIRPWLLSLEGDAAAVMASVLRDHADSARHFSSVADERTADSRIRQAIRESADPRGDQHL